MKRMILTSHERVVLKDSIPLINFKLLAVVFALLFVLAPATWAQEIEWIRQFGSIGPAEDFAEAVDADGNIYIAGRIDGTLPGQTSFGGTDAFVRKYNSDGSEGWTRQFGTGTYDYATGIAVDATGVYVVGYMGSYAFVRKYDLNGIEELWTSQFVTTSRAYGIAVGATGVYVAGYTGGFNNEDAFVRKYDPYYGTALWTRNIDTGSRDQARGIAVDANGVYVVGYTGSFSQVDVFVCKYDLVDPEEPLLWTHQFGTASIDYAYGISVDDKGVYVTGETNGTFTGQTSLGGTDAFVRKCNLNDGTEIWTTQFGTEINDRALGISVDGTGVYLSGYTYFNVTWPSLGDDDAFVYKYDTDGNFVWTHQFGTESNDQAHGISVDDEGVYVAGYTNGTFPGQTSLGGTDAFVRKYDLNGTEGWTRQFGSTLLVLVDDCAEVVDANGNIYIAGETNGTLPGQTSAGESDAFVRKYDPEGHVLWTCQFGTKSNDLAWGIAVDGSGVYVSGYTLGTFTDQDRINPGGSDAFVRKYDSDGNKLWTRQFGTEFDDYGHGISVDGTGVYVSGYSWTSAGDYDAFVRKYDLSGTVEEPLWIHQFGTASNNDYAYGISVDATGVYVTGCSQTSAGGYDAFVHKCNLNDGTEIWTSRFGTEFEDRAYGISAYGTGVYVSGYTNGTLPDQTSAGGYDAFVRKYDLNDGTELWTSQFGTAFTDCAYGISVDATGVYLAGYTYGTIGQSSAGLMDAFVRKYDPDGTELWTSQFGTDDDDRAYGISVHATGAYVAGYTRGIFEGQSSAGGNDAFVAKLMGGNQPPMVLAITAPIGPFEVNTVINASADFTDPDMSDTHTAIWDWGDGSDLTVIEITDGSRSVSGSHEYTAAGVYTITLTVTDDKGGTGQSIFQFIVVFDLSAGYVTGAGWIDSPEGAYTSDPSLTGKAKFGFVSKYKKGQSTPDGNTQFNFKTADLKFQSTSYDWLVIAGPQAKYKGSGTINGDGDYGFMLTAIDGELNGGGGIDKFRIKIWDEATEEVVYDNQSGDPDDGAATDAIEAGNIVIHKEAGLAKPDNFAEDIEPEAKPKQFALSQNYPNPFNPETMIRFQIPQSSHVMVRIFNTLGVEIQKVVNEQYQAGDYSVIWDGRDNSGKAVSSGTYIYQIQAGQYVDVKRMVLIR